jgi:hypothetical protein
MWETQPPDWWQPSAAPVRDSRPVYREQRPVRWSMVLLGVVASVIWYVVVAIASSGALLPGILVGMLVAAIATALLAWRGDPGLGIGAAIMVGFVLSLTILIGGSSLFVSLT